MLDFHQRRKWFQHYTEQIAQGAIKAPRLGIRYPCPCCGYPTLNELCSWEICDLCNWEDDGQDDPHADEVWGGPNRDYSLSEARNNFDRNLIMYNHDKPYRYKRIGGDTNTPKEERAKLAIIEAFEGMIQPTNQTSIDGLWELVYGNGKVLEREVYRKVREHDGKLKSKRPNG